MATNTNYVKFYRGSKAAFDALLEKNEDTLYFINDPDSNQSALYVGEKVVSGNVGSLSDLEDLVVSEVAGGQLLVYDEVAKAWVNKDISDAIGLMVGASASAEGEGGLVPAPGIGDEMKFLRGDGTWAAIETNADAVEMVEAVAKDLEDLAANVYTKEEVNGLISETGHLKRIVVNSLEEIDVNATGADQYIYMVHRVDDQLNDQYDEYMIINGALERLGSWEVDLVDYVKAEDLAEERAKLATVEEGAQKNLFDSVSGEFDIVDRKLSIKTVEASKVSGLVELVQAEVQEVEEQLNLYVDYVTYNQDKAATEAKFTEVMDILTWKDL